MEELNTETVNVEIIGSTEDYIKNGGLLDAAEDEFSCWGSVTLKYQIGSCESCGKPFYGIRDHFFCPSCAEERKINKPAIPKTCKDCGTKFLGYSNERRCPRCVETALEESYRKYWAKGGTERPLGSTDKCNQCGKEYTVTSSSQKYCSAECRKIAYLPREKEKSREYYRTSERTVEKKQRRKKAEKYCAYCMQLFKRSSKSNVCSDYCRAEYQKIKRSEDYVRRGLKNNYSELLDKRERYREQVKNENFQEAL